MALVMEMAGLRAFLLTLVAGLSVAMAEPLPPQNPIIGIDHIPLVVRDLEAAADTYRRLGFVLKPGRFHEDGIRNQHVKFEDGNGIELITAADERDSLTKIYLKLLAMGEGPAFLNFHTANLAALENRLAEAGHAYQRDGETVKFADPDLDYLFFREGDNRSPTDRPEYFAHPNTAHATIGVWIAGGEGPGLVKKLQSLGARIVKKTVFVPEKMTATVALVDNGEVVFLPAVRQVVVGRPIVGAVFQTGDLMKLDQILASAGILDSIRIATDGYHSIIVSPQHTHGVWLEFREQR